MAADNICVGEVQQRLIAARKRREGLLCAETALVASIERAKATNAALRAKTESAQQTQLSRMTAIRNRLTDLRRKKADMHSELDRLRSTTADETDNTKALHGLLGQIDERRKVVAEKLQTTSTTTETMVGHLRQLRDEVESEQRTRHRQVREAVAHADVEHRQLLQSMETELHHAEGSLRGMLAVYASTREAMVTGDPLSLSQIPVAYGQALPSHSHGFVGRKDAVAHMLNDSMI